MVRNADRTLGEGSSPSINERGSFMLKYFNQSRGVSDIQLKIFIGLFGLNLVFFKVLVVFLKLMIFFSGLK